MANSIGSETVRNWFGQPDAIGEMVEVIDFKGVDRQAVRKLGLRSKPFQIESTCDIASLSAGRTKYKSYKALIASGALQFIWNGHSLDTDGYRAIVLDVEIIDLSRKVVICGALTTNNTYDLRVRWTLLLVPYTAP